MDIEELMYLAKRLQQLAHKETTPTKIIGTGYKRPRDEAFIYLADRIMDELRGEEGVYDSAYFHSL
jgi:ABC-type nitrate/sulfonate/bicarbonate transport system ATPase subunit